ncbi:MAG: polyprenyl synthetase family protein [Candidatus Diapherotrites archaeon]|nr:polyprenyl synthetase family protein [Candidatus Diapherotrites archaeon]
MIKEYGGKIDAKLLEVLPLKSDDNGLITPWLNEPIWYHLGTGGKRLRPALALIVTKELGGNPDDALGFAAATEIIHNALLLHDDVEDGDRFRRDKPAVWLKYGMPNAVNCGDYMFFKAYRAVLDSPLPTETILRLMDIITLTLEKTGEGQTLDLNMRADESLTIDRYLEIAEGKTGFYFAFSFVGGAIIAGLPKELTDELWAIGKTMGPAFQIRDDIIDLTEGKGRGGEKGNDIREGKPSVLVAYALTRINAGEKKQLLEILGKPRDQTTNYDVRWVVGLYNKYDVIEYCQEFSKKLAKRAFSVIDGFPLDNKQVFYDIAKFIVERRA